MICKKCGSKQVCNNCSLYLTFHRLRDKAICHHCSFEKNINIKCEIEKNCDFIMYGPGVEKIYEEVKTIFPKKKVDIFSSDYLKTKEKEKFYFRR